MLTATNISCYDAAKIEELPSNTVLISINEEWDELNPLKLDRQSSKILTIKFSDITSRTETLEGKIYTPISGETVLKILDFININRNKNFLVHCARGISRSAAICLYLNIIHGHKLKDDFWKSARPNPYVLGKLMVARFCNGYK